MDEEFALYRLNGCLHEICKECYPKIKGLCPLCRGSVHYLLPPAFEQLWPLMVQYSKTNDGKLGRFLFDRELKEYFSSFVPLYIDKNTKLDLLLNCANACVNKSQKTFLIASHEYNTDNIRFWKAGQGSLHPGFDFIHQEIRKHLVPERLKQWSLLYNGIDVVRTVIETTDGHRMNALQWLVNELWWTGNTKLK